jgi:hypothetical protein
MSDEEFEILDELYFVISYQELKEGIDLSDRELFSLLKSLHQKGWIRIFENPDEEVKINFTDIGNRYTEYYYLASKKGLLAHNSN